MLRAFMKTALTLLSTMAILGCAAMHKSGETPLNRNWGRSFESAKHMQIANPDPGRNTAPVAGIVGPAGEIAMEWYLKGFAGLDASRGKPKSTISAVTIQP